jgi:cytochrome P450
VVSFLLALLWFAFAGPYHYALASYVAPSLKHELTHPTEPDRLPSFADRPALPYLDAVVSECLRWNPVGNVSLAHYLTEDDVYRGWRVPKGTTVLANIWCVAKPPSIRPI